jgi:hypothetical protein
VLIFEHERLSREPKGKGWGLLQILISRDFETGETPQHQGGYHEAFADHPGRVGSFCLRRRTR